MNKKSIFKDGANKNLTHPKTQKGITLVALIITIIVLLILAVVAIRAVQGDNIIAHAENARDKYNEAQVNEQVELDKYTGKIEQALATPISKVQLNEMLTKTTNTTTYDMYGNKIVVPAGFKILVDNTTGYTKDNLDVTKGIVIQDKDGNEFVWIPVGTINHLDKDGKETTTTITLGRYDFDSSGVASAYSGSYTEDTASTHNSSYKNAIAKDIEAFKTSANTNCGYYLARYEAGVTGYDANNITTSNSNNEINWTGYTAAEGKRLTLVSKSGQQVWNYVTQNKASELCKNMYTSKPFESDLTNSYAWDTAIVFIQTFSTETDASTYSQLNKSTGFRNTGMNPDKYCNIHDMSGNAKEWSTETSSNAYNPFVDRGGYTIRYSGTGDYTSLRSFSSVTGSSIYSFRPLLYL